MRILIIHNYYKQAGGEDVVFRNEADLLRNNGHNVEQLSFSNDVMSEGVGSFFKIFRLIYNSSSARILKKRIRSFKPDIIHVHNTFVVASPAIYFVAKKFKIPVVQTLHNYRLICPGAILYHNGKIYEDSIKSIFPLKSIFRGVYRNSIPQTAMMSTITGFHKILGTWRSKIDTYIALSEFAKEKYLNSSLNVSEQKIVVKPNFTFDAGFDNNKEDYFIFVGRLNEEKGIKTVVKAFENTHFKLKIIGSGDLDQFVKNSANENKNISYLGFKDHDTITTQLKKARGLIFASSLYETFGLAIIEAFSCATPVLVSSLGGHSQMVEEGETGYHFKVNDSDDLKEKLSFFDDEVHLLDLSKNARRVFEEKYSPDVNYKQLIEVYQRLIKSPKQKI